METNYRLVLLGQWRLQGNDWLGMWLRWRTKINTEYWWEISWEMSTWQTQK